MTWRQQAPVWFRFLLYAGLLLLLCCATVKEAAIEDLKTQSKQTGYRVSVTGRRDGDLLPVRVLFETPSSRLLMDLRFRVGVPTSLESGTFQREENAKTVQGRVRARSVDFLGGQSDNPNLGGVFELLSSAGTPTHKVTLPTSEVMPSSGPAPVLAPSH